MKNNSPLVSREASFLSSPRARPRGNSARSVSRKSTLGGGEGRRQAFRRFKVAPTRRSRLAILQKGFAKTTTESREERRRATLLSGSTTSRSPRSCPSIDSACREALSTIIESLPASTLVVGPHRYSACTCARSPRTEADEENKYQQLGTSRLATVACSPRTVLSRVFTTRPTGWRTDPSALYSGRRQRGRHARQV